MCDIQITARDHGLFRIQRAEIVAEGIVPRHPVVDALEPVLRIRRVAGDEEELLKFQRDEPSLGVKLRNTDAVADAARFRL